MSQMLRSDKSPTAVIRHLTDESIYRGRSLSRQDCKLQSMACLLIYQFVFITFADSGLKSRACLFSYWFRCFTSADSAVLCRTCMRHKTSACCQGQHTCCKSQHAPVFIIVGVRRSPHGLPPARPVLLALLIPDHFLHFAVPPASRHPGSRHC